MAGVTRIDLDATSFDAFVQEGGLRAVEFWSSSSGSARLMASKLERVLGEGPWTAIIGRIDLRSNRILAQRLRAHRLPSVFLYLGGELIAKAEGPGAWPTLRAALDSLSTLAPSDDI